MQLSISGNISHNQKERNMAAVLCLGCFFCFLPVVYVFLLVCRHPFTSGCRSQSCPERISSYSRMCFLECYLHCCPFPPPLSHPVFKEETVIPNIPNNIRLFLWYQIYSSKNFKVFLIKLNKHLLRELFKYEYITLANKWHFLSIS